MAGLAAAVNAVELLLLRGEVAHDGVWRASALAPEWGVLAPLLRPAVFTTVAWVQLLAALGVVARAGSQLGAVCALLLCVCTLFMAARFRGTVNGGSDGMLFTVLGGVSVAQWEGAVGVVREGAVLYIAAQLTLSYVRAGLVKVREREWWNGRALGAFLALPAYGVPSGIPRNAALLRVAGVAVMAFELAAPLSWVTVTASTVFIASAVLFHAGAALVFGLNRFLWAWGAALPALWYAAQRVG